MFSAKWRVGAEAESEKDKIGADGSGVKGTEEVLEAWERALPGPPRFEPSLSKELLLRSSTATLSRGICSEKREPVLRKMGSFENGEKASL